MLKTKLISKIENINEEVIVGIDEAGRGPVIGPMVYACYVQRVSNINKERIYFDSKKLKPSRRNNLFKEMNNYAYVSIEPIYITTHMNQGICNLNEIAKNAVKKLLREVQKKCKNVKNVFIDGLGNNETYKKELSKIFDFNFTIENKADDKYEIVSAASVVAKVIRDSWFDEEFEWEMKEYAINFNLSKKDCGSGYTSDPNTQKWIKKNKKAISGLPVFVRHSYKTANEDLTVERKRLQRYKHFYIAKDK